jgi:cyclic beta-1,2-glucan synthetase
MTQLAPRQRVASPLLKRFFENQRILVRARRDILGRGHPEIHGIDADWLADNFHIVDDVLREVRQDLPRGYDAVLPKLGVPPLLGYPRVYALALAVVAHTDSELDEPRISRFVQAFQEVVPLTIGELWALPTMFRLVLIENLRRLAVQMLRGWGERQRAERWCQEATASARTSGPDRQGNPPEFDLPPLGELSDPFVVRLVQLLRDQPEIAPAACRRLESELAAVERESDEVLRREHHRQAADQVTVGNCVLSLRLLSAIDWNSFFERTSMVERILRGDPAGAYPLQDFPTSDRCRKAVERIARGSNADELDVAQKAIALSRSGLSRGSPEGYVGYYLVGRGEAELRAAFEYRPMARERVLDLAIAHPERVYFGSLLLLLGTSLLLLSHLALRSLGTVASLWLPLALLSALLPLSELVVGLVNHCLTLLLPPRVLPKLEFKEGITEEFATFVVMPSMLDRPRSAELLCERLEIHYLANPTSQVRFALLTDFGDAPHEEMPGDQSLIEDALSRVRALNQRYAADGPDLFFLFHRRRQWNPAQNCWMGWERKRGKLSEFNRLLRREKGTSYAVSSADPAELPATRFVITLDADTQMPRDTVGRLVGTLAHPLNQPRFDPASGRVVEGYGVLQPRVSFHLKAATHSHFAALLAASGGIDPYSTAASDAYMDLFGLGSFTGKGIYDVAAFEASTGATFPDNHILSHDLIEGNYARCGLLSDTELFDDFPARYLAYARREHRWVRGDWQLIPWLGRTVPVPGGRRQNPLPTLERWKLLDNLRRSLVPPAVLVMLALGWSLLPGSPWLWTAIALGIMSLPLLKWLIRAIVACVRAWSLVGLLSWRASIPATAGQALLTVVFLADQSRLMCDAVARTLWRLLVTRRRLLEWETAAATERRLGTGLRDHVAGLWGAPALALTILVAIAAVRPSSLWAAAPFLAAWFLSPLVAFWVSRPKGQRELILTETERRELRRIARKTWHFFERFVGEEDHWLPPDNFQEVPDGRVAHRTSPTNHGLLLLSTLAAHDLGYLGFGKLVDRLERTFDTLEQLERRWGHFFNWYNTRTLEPLPPAYISTVDSGNFLACLVTLTQGLKEKLREPVLGPWVTAGLADTFLQIEERQRRAARLIEDLLQEQPADLGAWDDWLRRIENETEKLLNHLRGSPAAEDADPEKSREWAEALHAAVRERRAEIASLAPWPSLRRDAPCCLDELSRVSEELSAGPLSPEQHYDRPATAATRASTCLQDRLLKLIDRARAMGAAMEFCHLYKSERHLYALGADLSQGRLDGSCYDLLASESCLTSYLTVARGDAPRRHWFHLGRPYIRAAGRIGLLSWGGTMFEYLMPRLLLRSLPGTLLAEACQTAVARQIEYGQQLGIPWGISESGFSSQFLSGDYRYQAFGVPGLGLKRGLENDKVIAPYATIMATMIAPREALSNLRRLTCEGGEGPYGYYEAIDYTPERLPQGHRAAVVRSYMAHHQGMSLVALSNVLLHDVMPRRFHSEPMVRASELLLQERISRDTEIVESSLERQGVARTHQASTGVLLSRRLTSPFTIAPRTHLLSNSRYHVMITNAGSGYSKIEDLDVTRWRADPTCERWGQFYYVRDRETGVFWSAGHQPVCRLANHYEVVFSNDKALIRRRDGEIETQIEITVSPEQLAEVRRITLTNHGIRARELEVTSYLEPVLGDHGSDLAHPAFGKLFLETEYLRRSDSLLCRRRPRSMSERPLWCVHVIAVDHSSTGCTLVGKLEYETDRARFVGRGRTLAEPAALDPHAPLSETVGPVLDPILTLRRSFRVAAGGSAVIGFTLAIAESRSAAESLADQYHGISAVARAFELAWAHSQVQHGHRPGTPEEAHLYQRLGAHLLFAGSTLRGHSRALTANCRGPSLIRESGLPSEQPFILARIAESAELSLIRQLMVAQEFLRLRGLRALLVVTIEDQSSEEENLCGQIVALVSEAGLLDPPDRPAVRLIHREHLSDEQALALEATAHVVFEGSRGSLASQLDRIEWVRPFPEVLRSLSPRDEYDEEPVQLPPGLQFFNGLGGFAADGRAYCLLVGNLDLDYCRRNGQAAGPRPPLPPAPWINVVANSEFGFIVSETGSGFTWAGNSHTNRLTCWSNDPVADPPSEVIYLRDESTGQVWCPTPLPIPTSSPTLVCYGQGYSQFDRNTHGIAHQLTLFVPQNDPIKVLRLRLQNTGSRPRQLSATFFVEWVLGMTRDQSAMYVVTELDPDTGALLARNALREEFSHGVAFADVNRRPRTVTADRVEFLGRHGSPAAAEALGRVGLSGRTGSKMDPCAAIQTCFGLGPGESTEIDFLLGEAEDLDRVRALVRRYWDPSAIARALDDVKEEWNQILQTVQVRTPDPAFDLLMNRWLLYQVISCRLWARSAFYQSGGAFGFRDQLQDVMALPHAAANLTREHIIRAASRQFVEGDVQHWWHPPGGRGIRTRTSDDLVWLPYVTAYYVKLTGDSSVLDEVVPFLRAPTLEIGQDADFCQPEDAGQSSSLYEHCVRALEHGVRLGIHGLPLMGCGDWNDGLNRVGAKGQGESVWLAWFLVDCLRRFAQVCDSRGDELRSTRFQEQAREVCAAIERFAWDGSWYLRAFFDDGTPLGSLRGAECQIDSIAQSWSVISGGANPERSRKAMQSVEERLIRKEDGLVLLLAPPFDEGLLDPGYIRGYLPGSRENGAQYTHAAAWVVQAFALLGQGQLAFRLFQYLNPIHHASNRDSLHRYKVEPYVVAGDVLSLPPHVGRGGWTWYTGSAGWLYGVGLESILGLHRQGNLLRFDPRIPPDWPNFEITYRSRSATYHILVENPHGLERGTPSVFLDGRPCDPAAVSLRDDHQEHMVRVLLERP